MIQNNQRMRWSASLNVSPLHYQIAEPKEKTVEELIVIELIDYNRNGQHMWTKRCKIRLAVSGESGISPAVFSQCLNKSSIRHIFSCGFYTLSVIKLVIDLNIF